MTKKSYGTALVAGGFCALSLVVAPMASAAQSTATCNSVGTRTTLCQSNGSASLHTSPEFHTYAQMNPYWPGPGYRWHR